MGFDCSAGVADSGIGTDIDNRILPITTLIYTADEGVRVPGETPNNPTRKGKETPPNPLREGG